MDNEKCQCSKWNIFKNLILPKKSFSFDNISGDSENGSLNLFLLTTKDADGRIRRCPLKSCFSSVCVFCQCFSRSLIRSFASASVSAFLQNTGHQILLGLGPRRQAWC